MPRARSTITSTELAHHYGRSDNSMKAPDISTLPPYGCRTFSLHRKRRSHVQCGISILLARRMPARDRQKSGCRSRLALLLALGSPTLVTKVERRRRPKDYVRARELCRRREKSAALRRTFRLTGSLPGQGRTQARAGDHANSMLSHCRSEPRTCNVCCRHITTRRLADWSGSCVGAPVADEARRATMRRKHSRSMSRPLRRRRSCGLRPLPQAWTCGSWASRTTRCRARRSIQVRLAQQLSAGHDARSGLSVTLHGFRRDVASAIEQAREASALSEDQYGFRALETRPAWLNAVRASLRT